MNNISSIRSSDQYPKTENITKAAPNEHLGQMKNNNIRSRDVYVAGGNKEEQILPSNTSRRLSDFEKKDLTSRYDVKNMSFEDRTHLLQELESAGMITSQELWTLKYGAVPIEFADGYLEYQNGNVLGEAYIDSRDCSYGDIRDLYNLSDTDWSANYQDISNYLDGRMKNTKDDKLAEAYKKYSSVYNKIDDIFQQLLS